MFKIWQNMADFLKKLKKIGKESDDQAVPLQIKKQIIR